MNPKLQPDPDALLRPDELDRLKAVIDDLGQSVLGLVVVYEARRILLLPNTAGDDDRRQMLKDAANMDADVCVPGLAWQALAEADDGAEFVLVEGTGATPLEALAECAKSAAMVELGEDEEERDVDLDE